ncbi:MAG: helix-turn-helix transcriptional regulator [Sphingobacteriales bacterium]|nr:helix-turn-helix transcriptional regulator [Sphingobacteriales bacterium]
MSLENGERLAIKNMVCPRCIKAVREGLISLGYEVGEVQLGFAQVFGKVNRKQVSEFLHNNGFELLTDKDQQLVNQAKSAIISLIQSSSPILHQNLSSYLSAQLRVDYPYLSALFSEVEGITIERYFILQRIEKVKELLVYNELNLKEIAFQMGYSSVAHLSAQFKKITGFTTSHFKEIGFNKRKSIDQLH